LTLRHLIDKQVVLAALLFIVAILATATAIFQIAARLRAFGLGIRGVAVRNSHVGSNIVLTAILWVAWCYLVGVLCAPPAQFFDGVDAPSDGIEVCHAGDVA